MSSVSHSTAPVTDGVPVVVVAVVVVVAAAAAVVVVAVAAAMACALFGQPQMMRCMRSHSCFTNTHTATCHIFCVGNHRQ